jgi:hypothetical protein
MTYEPQVNGVVATRAEFWGNKANGGARVCLRNSDMGPEDWVTAEVDRDHIVPWASTEEWEAIGRLNTAAGAIADEAIDYGTASVLLSRFQMRAMRDALTELTDLRTRMGW